MNIFHRIIIYWDNKLQIKGKLVATELYDRISDTDENTNIANKPGSSELITELSNQLKAGWQEAIPK